MSRKFRLPEEAQAESMMSQTECACFDGEQSTIGMLTMNCPSGILDGLPAGDPFIMSIWAWIANSVKLQRLHLRSNLDSDSSYQRDLWRQKSAGKDGHSELNQLMAYIDTDCNCASSALLCYLNPKYLHVASSAFALLS